MTVEQQANSAAHGKTRSQAVMMILSKHPSTVFSSCRKHFAREVATIGEKLRSPIWRERMTMFECLDHRRTVKHVRVN